jgi:hypothetical protein
LVRASFYLPAYDITFSNSAKNRFVVRRLRKDGYVDFNHLSNAAVARIVAFCGKDYLPLLRTLIHGTKAEVTAYFNAEKVGAEYRDFWDMVEYPGGSTNWQYRAAKSYLASMAAKTR